jgi:pimeloyl-ACP methyl ester carboxylesterase
MFITNAFVKQPLVHFSDACPTPDAPAVVLLHGYLETRQVWSSFVNYLYDGGYRVIWVDLPGSERALSGSENGIEFMADSIDNILQSLSVPKAVVVGHSMGGYVALAFAQKYSGRLDKLCLFHSTPNADSDEKKRNRDREIALIGEGKLQTLIHASLRNLLSSENLENTAIMTKLERIVEASDRYISPDDAVFCLQGMKNRKDMNAFLQTLQQPTLMIFGKHDRHIPEATAYALKERFPAAQWAMLENSGHLGFVEQPAESAEILLNFINQHKK